MDIFDSINLYLMHHPVMLSQLLFFFRLKFWILLALGIYFVSLPYRAERKERKRRARSAKAKDRFLA